MLVRHEMRDVHVALPSQALAVDKALVLLLDLALVLSPGYSLTVFLALAVDN